MTELKSSSSGQHMLELQTRVEDAAPVDTAPPSVPSLRPAPQVDTQRLLEAWHASTEVQRQLIQVIAANEEDNRRTRVDNRTTRLVALGAFMACGVLGVFGARSVHLDIQRTIAEATAVRGIAESTAQDVAATLRAVRAVSKALGAKVEADAQLTPDAEANAQAAAVEAQAAALQAERSVTDDPATKQKANVELEALRVKAKRLQVQVKVDTPDAAPAASGGKP